MNSVKRILSFNSVIFQIFFIVSINFIYNYNVTASPPAASIALFAEAVNLCAVTLITYEVYRYIKKYLEYYGVKR